MRSTCPKEGHKFGLFVSLGQLNIRIFFDGFSRCFHNFFFFNWYFENVDVWYFYSGLIYWIRSADVFFTDKNYILLKKVSFISQTNSYRLEYVDYIIKLFNFVIIESYMYLFFLLEIFQ